MLYVFYLPHFNAAVQLPAADEVDRLLRDPAMLKCVSSGTGVPGGLASGLVVAVVAVAARACACAGVHVLACVCVFICVGL